MASPTRFSRDEASPARSEEPGEPARADDVAPVAELFGAAGPDRRDGVRARAERIIERIALGDDFIR
jgi:hypothetical protein